LHHLFENPTIAELSQQVEAHLQQKSKERTLAIGTVARNNAKIPLSFAQQQLWLQTQLIPANKPVYNESVSIHIKGPLNIEALERSLHEMLYRHEILRTHFIKTEKQPVQVISSTVEFELAKVDLRKWPTAERKIECIRLATLKAQQAFNLEKGALFRVLLIQLEDKNYRLILVLHHIIFDGISLYSIFLPELEILYQAFSQGQSSPLPQLSFQYADYAYWQQKNASREKLEAQLSYWKQQLADLPTLQLPTDRPRPATQSFRGARHRIALSKALTKALKTLNQQEGVTLFMTLLTAFKILLYRYAEQKDILVGTVTAGGRNRLELEGIMGYFLNPLVLRTHLSGHLSFLQLLKRIRTMTLDAYTHENLPFEQVLEAVHPKRHLTAHPLFQVAFILNPPLPKLKNWHINPFYVHTGTAKFDLTLELDETLEDIIGQFEYSTDLFDEATIIRLSGHFQTLLEGIIANPEQSISKLPLLTPKEQQQLRDWNNTQRDFPQDKCIHQLFENQVKQTSNAIALIFENQQLSYQELNQRANQLAYYLRTLGVKPETLVGLCVERSLEMIIAILAIFKAGGAYVPLDPKYPQERLIVMLRDAQVQILLTQQPIKQKYPLLQEGLLSLCLDTEWEKIANQTQENPVNKTNPNHLAYVIYTSGSTGKPKGVALEHRGLCNLVTAQRDTFGIQPSDRILQYASISFDASIWEIVMALISGATLDLGKKELLLLGRPLLQLLRKRAITTATLPPSALATLPVEKLTTLQTIIVAGEACSAGLVARWAPGRRFFNAYGPTETTVCETIAECKESTRPPPIGHPIANTQIYVLDAQLQPVPMGLSGELYISGVNLARGYLNRPELTAKKFIPNPFSLGTRLYKTGDLVRYHADGNLEFLGRIDHQVKIRGFRIELGEIEAILHQHPEIQAVKVLVDENNPNDKRLVAYWVAKQQPAPSSTALRHFLSKKLPYYMIPSAFILLEKLPLTLNGKVDHKALSQLEKFQQDSQDSYAEPRTELEQIIVSVWQEILDREKVGIHETFFDLGGNSLLVVQVQDGLTKILNRSIPVTALFQYPTVYTLARYLSQSPNNSKQNSSKTPHNRISKKKTAISRQKKYRELHIKKLKRT